ncbi:MAG: response regulator [Polyangiales bacterium]
MPNSSQRWYDSARKSLFGAAVTCSDGLPKGVAPAAATTIDDGEVFAHARATAPGKGWRALVADDDEDMRFLMASTLRRAGFSVFELANGRELLRAFDEAPSTPTVVVSDIGMPDLDGIAATKVLSAKVPRPTIVLVTAFGDRATLQLAKDAGADRVLLKPIDIGLLVQTAIAASRHSS